MIRNIRAEAKFSEGKKYEQDFQDFHRKEDAEQALSCYQAAVEAQPAHPDAVRARDTMLKTVERCREIEAARNAFHTGKTLTAEEMYVLGRDEADGFMTAKNQKQGMLWIWDAAEHGHVQAKFEIGEYYLLTGRRESRTIEDGIAFIRSAAENGCVQAQYKLGNIYSIGLHVEKDPEEARKWYAMAAENGKPSALSHLRRLEKNYR